MGLEYIVTRLKAMRSKFIADNDVESIVSGKELKSIVLLLNDSIFRDEVEKLTSEKKQKITINAIGGCIDYAFLNICQKVYNIVLNIYPEIAEVVFSRWELEQIKYAVRYLSSKETVYAERFKFLSLLSNSRWIDNWRSYQSISQFQQVLKTSHHPFALAIESSKSGFDPVKAEINLERYYFQKYLPEKKEYIGDVWEYYIDQCDLVNIHQSYLLHAKPEYYDQVEKYFIDGPGRIKLNDCLALLRSAPEGFRRVVENKLHCTLKPESERSAVSFSLSIRQSFLKKYLRKTIEDPNALWYIFLFLEELGVMVSNLKLAIRFSRTSAPFHQVTDYFVRRKIV